MPKTRTPIDYLVSPDMLKAAMTSPDPVAYICGRSPMTRLTRLRVEKWLVAEVMALPAFYRDAFESATMSLAKTNDAACVSASLANIAHVLRRSWAGAKAFKLATDKRAVGVSPSSALKGETLTFKGIDDAPSLTLTQRQIINVCADIEKMLLAKNRKYGDSALNPKRVFSKADVIEQIKVRIDDKLSRIESSQSDEDEDVIDDLIGYLVLLKVAMMRQGAKALPSGQPEGKRKGR